PPRSGGGWRRCVLPGGGSILLSRIGAGFHPRDPVNLRGGPQGRVDRVNGCGQNSAATTPEQRSEEASLSFQPAEPTITCLGVVRLEANDHAVFDTVNVKREVPAKVFLLRLICRRQALGPQLLDQPARQVIAEAAIIDEIVPRLC